MFRKLFSNSRFASHEGHISSGNPSPFSTCKWEESDSDSDSDSDSNSDSDSDGDDDDEAYGDETINGDEIHCNNSMSPTCS